MNQFLRVLFLCALVAPAGCNRPAGESATGPTPEAAGAPPALTVVKPERRTLRHTVNQPGRVEAFEQTPLYARVAGYVKSVHADIGARIVGPHSNSQGLKVAPGQVLAELDVPELAEELKQKEALIAQSAEEVKQAEESVHVAEAARHSAASLLKEAEAARPRAEAQFERWRVEFQRAEENVRKGVLDAQSRDEVHFQLESARAARNEVEAKVQSARAAVQEAEAKTGKARADVRVADARRVACMAARDHTAALLGYTHIEAPYDGVVIRRLVNTGDFYQPAAGGKGDPIFVVARIDPVRVFVEVPETDAVLIRDGDQAVVRVRARQNEAFDGVVARTSWALDPRARTLYTEIKVANPHGRLRPGMYATAAITIERKDAWSLPASAVQVHGDLVSVFRVVAGKAVHTAARVGLRDGAWIGLLEIRPDDGSWREPTATDEFVEKIPAGLVDGQPVRP